MRCIGGLHPTSNFTAYPALKLLTSNINELLYFRDSFCSDGLNAS